MQDFNVKTTANAARQLVDTLAPAKPEDAEYAEQMQGFRAKWIADKVEDKRAQAKGTAVRMIEQLQRLVEDLDNEDLTYYGNLGIGQLVSEAHEVTSALDSIRAQREMLQLVAGLIKENE